MQPQFATIATPGEIVVSTSFNLEIGDVTGTIHFCIPYATLEPIRDVLFSSTQGDAIEVDRRWVSVLTREIQAAEVNLVVDLAHAEATVSELLINKAAWDKLPKDLQAIVSNAAAACNVISEGWCQKANSDAMEDLIKNHKVVAKPLPDGVIKALRTETDKVLAEAVAKDPLVKKVHDSYFSFKAKFDRWSEISEEAYHVKVRG